jgi:hypothetical protein
MVSIVPLEILGATILGCLIVTATVLLLTRYRKRRDALVMRERTAREQMQELCPNGWSARIMVYGEGAPLPDDVPSEDRRVCVEWAEYEPDPEGHNQVAVARRMWAKTISGALHGIVADRTLDRQLEEIEQSVMAESGGGETG